MNFFITSGPGIPQATVLFMPFLSFYIWCCGLDIAFDHSFVFTLH